MNANIIAIVKNWLSRVSLAELNLCHAGINESSRRAGITMDEQVTVLIMIVCMKYKADLELATTLLVELSEESNGFNLHMIFKGIDFSFKAARELGYKYLCVPAYRSVIASRFKECGIFCEDQHIYDTALLESYLENRNGRAIDEKNYCDRHGMAKQLPDYSNCKRSLTKLFATLNTPDYKMTKKTMLHLSHYDISEFVPALTERGFQNLRQLGNGRLYEKVCHLASPQHPSETIRTDLFRSYGGFEDMISFFNCNQFIEDPNNQRILAKHFANTIERLLEHHNKLSQVSADNALRIYRFVHDVVVRMCKSTVVCRRSLGASLLVASLGIIQDCDEFTGVINDLIYDKAHEVREIVSPVCSIVKVPRNTIVARLLTHRYYIVYGATNHAACIPSDYIFKAFCKTMFYYLKTGRYKDIQFSDTSGNDKISDFAYIMDNIEKLQGLPVFGFVHCLASRKYSSNEFRSIVEVLHRNALEHEGVLEQRTLKECSLYFRQMNDAQSLMNTLLNCDHFGVVNTIKQHLQTMSTPCEFYIHAGLDSIRKNTVNTRKSGGLTVYFLSMANDSGSYYRIREALEEMLGDGINTVFATDVNVAFHCLNILSALMDQYLFNDFLFYFEITFKCLRHASFSIKNCGFAMFSTIIHRTIQEYHTFDALFIVQNKLRTRIATQLSLAIENSESHIIYFLLHILSEIKLLNGQETTLLNRCMSGSGVIKLRAERILCAQPVASEFNAEAIESRKPAIVFSASITELEKFVILYKALFDSSDAKAEAAKIYLIENYGIGTFSVEYTLHKLVELVIKYGYAEQFITCISEHSKFAGAPGTKFFDEEVDCDAEDPEYVISLFSTYSSKI